MDKLLVIVGPTATGKSDLAVFLAQKYNGEVISADSRQVYTGLDIGSGKITKEEMEGVPHHLLDVADPQKQFSVAQYKTIADEAIENILKREKLPILCGGTGFYIEAVIDDVTLPEVGPDNKLREELNKSTTEELVKKLELLDPERLKKIDSKNKRRLVRAIEIASALGSVPTQTKNQRWDTLMIGIDLPDEILKEKISKRLHARMEKMIEEINSLYEKRLSWERMEELGLEYRYVALYLQSKMSQKEMTETLQNESWHFAKRQRTWFKRDKRIVWYKPEEREKMTLEIEKFLQKSRGSE